MRPDWPWPAIVALAIPAGLGHLCHFILVINVCSGLGYPESVMDRLRPVLYSGLWVSSALLLGKHLQHPWWAWPWPLWSYAALCTISGSVGWPLASLALAVRRRPEGVAPQDQARCDLAAPGRHTDLIGPGRHSWLLRLPGNEAFRLCLREWDVALPGLPDPLDGLQIVQITDLHLAPCFDCRYFQRVLEACRGWDADLLVLTGDVVEHAEAIGWIEPLLRPLGARLGKFAILGNHDYQHPSWTILDQLNQAGFETLEGQWTGLEANGVTIALGGTAAPWGPDVDPRAMPPADFRILLSHSPDRFYQAARWGIDLMFCGHNHGGQIRLPLVGAVFMPSVYSRRFDRGFFRRGKTLMYVSEGIAGRHPYRWGGCPPEITRFVLRTGRASTARPDLEFWNTQRQQREALERDWV
ncbi:MAG TPA: metallophosphoesterase [Isosphaeraceae bacterium]|nr:metallophosphoesterase [Isosphaeraceae bacterium]